MKKSFIFLFAVVLSFSVTGTVNAALINNGGGLIYDTVQNITWYDYSFNYSSGNPLTLGSSQHQWDAWTWAANLTVNGVSGWSLPTVTTACTGTGCTGSQYAMLYSELQGVTNPFTQLRADSASEYYWSGTPNNPGSSYYYSFQFYDGVQRDSSGKGSDDGAAFAVHAGDVLADGTVLPNGPAVPIPGAVWLLGSGLIGLAGVRRKFKK